MMYSEFHLHPLIEYLAVVLWAISGVLVGQERGFDVVGVFAVALVSATGGDILRDGVFLQQSPWIVSQPLALPIVLAAVLVGVLLLPLLQQVRGSVDKIVATVDAFGTPAFAIVGLTLALAADISLPAAIFIGMVTGVGGGVIRDVLVGEVPALFRPGQYFALIVLLGLLLYLGLISLRLLAPNLAAWTGIAVVFLLRLLVIRYNWRTLSADQITTALANSLSMRKPRPKKAREKPTRSASR